MFLGCLALTFPSDCRNTILYLFQENFQSAMALPSRCGNSALWSSYQACPRALPWHLLLCKVPLLRISRLCYAYNVAAGADSGTSHG